MLTGEGRIVGANPKTAAHTIYVPAKVANDSAYPFPLKEKKSIRVIVEIVDGKLVINHLEKKKQ